MTQIFMNFISFKKSLLFLPLYYYHYMNHFNFMKFKMRRYEDATSGNKRSYAIQKHYISENKLDITINISGMSQVSSTERITLLLPFFIEKVKMNIESKNETCSTFILFN